MQPKNIKTLSSLAIIGCIVSTFIHLSSYFFHFAFSFAICIFLIPTLFILAITVIAQKMKVNSNSVSIILLIYAIATFFITVHLLGDFQVEKNGLEYVLKKRAIFVREATVEEYNLYKSRLSRLMSGYFMFFFQLLYTTLKFSNSK